MTDLKTVYDAFFSLITDDMYMELTPEETQRDLRSLFMASLPLYEFPPKALRVTTNESGFEEFNRDLDLEEINILAYGMLQIWL